MISVFTTITDQKDTLLENLEVKSESKAEWVAFMDTPTPSKTWEIKPAYNRFVDPRRNSRIQKILPHQYFDSEYTIYIDGNIRLLKTPEVLIDSFLKDYDLALFKHPNRDCIYDEAIKCAVKQLDDPEVIIEQAKKYEDSGFAKHKGLGECNILFRRNTPKVREFNNAWWSEFTRHSRRDQISFMYAVDTVGIPVNIIDSPFLMRADGSAIRADGSAEIFIHNHFL